MSVADILATLYFGVLQVEPKASRAPTRDRLILSKGHASGALYATLAEAGFMPVDMLQTYMKPLSMLNGHPNRSTSLALRPIPAHSAMVCRLPSASP